jgi:hypothetical protein
MNAIYSAGISAIVGVSAAIATVTFMSRSSGKTEASLAPEKAATPKGPTVQAARTIVVQATDTERLRAIEERIDGLSKAEARAAEPAAPRDPEEGRRLLAEKTSELNRLHEQERPDPTWSLHAEQALSKGLDNLGGALGFSVKNAECKTTRCRAVVQWPDRDAAERSASQLAERSFPELNCEQTVLRSDPTDARVSGMVTLYLNCSQQRAGVVEGSVKQP